MDIAWVSSIAQWASLVTQLVKSLPAMKRTWVWFLAREDPGGENGNALQFCCLENPMDGGAWQATVYGVTRVGHDWVTKYTYRHIQHSLFIHIFIIVYLLFWRYHLQHKIFHFDIVSFPLLLVPLVSYLWNHCLAFSHKDLFIYLLLRLIIYLLH